MPRLTAPVASSWAAPGGGRAGRAALTGALPTTCPPSPWTALRAAHSRLDNPRPPGAQPSLTACGRGLPTPPTAPTTTGLSFFRFNRELAAERVGGQASIQSVAEKRGELGREVLGCRPSGRTAETTGALRPLEAIMEQRKHHEEGKAAHRNGSHGHTATAGQARHRGPSKSPAPRDRGFRARVWAMGVLAAAAACVWSIALVRKCEGEDPMPVEVDAALATASRAAVGGLSLPTG